MHTSRGRTGAHAYGIHIPLRHTCRSPLRRFSMADDEAITDGATRRPPPEIVATRRHAHWVTDVAGHGLTVLTLVGHTAPVFARTALGDGLGLPIYGTVVLAQQHG